MVTGTEIIWYSAQNSVNLSKLLVQNSLITNYMDIKMTITRITLSFLIETMAALLIKLMTTLLELDLVSHG